MEIDVVETPPAEVDADVLAFAVSDPVELPAAGQEPGRAIGEGTALGPYAAGRWKTHGNDRRRPVERLVLCGPGAVAVAEEAKRANIVATWTNRCRDFVNAPPNECTPARLAEW